jgi:phenylpropionate dioxygenase-like ring-hydroxylating dioxygenase large terminal subunit
MSTQRALPFKRAALTMTLPSSALIRASVAAARSLADRSTPFIFNEWYVGAFGSEVGRALFKRRILGRNVVMFRTTGGVAVVLDDRCAHRSFPLSAGRLDGDTLVCGYHGFRYDARGDCIEVPSQARCPAGIGVRNFVAVERGPLIWVWMGDPQRADEGRIPAQPWLSAAEWTRSQGYFALPASYVTLHENLMDLTHLSYLHAGSFGTTDYARAPYEIKLEEGHYTLIRHVVPTRLPPVWAQPTGILSDRAARITTSEFLSPGLHLVSGLFYDTALPPEQRREFRIRTAHIATPETQTSTHYFIVHGRDFAGEQDEVTRFMHEQLFTAFQEDVIGLTALEQVLAEAGPHPYEISVASDGPAVAMRRYLKRRSDEEHAAAAPASPAHRAAACPDSPRLPRS